MGIPMVRSYPHCQKKLYRYPSRPSRSRRIRTDKVDPSMQEIRIAESKTMLISLFILYWPFHQQLFAGGAKAGDPKIQRSNPAPSTSVSLSAQPIETAYYQKYKTHKNVHGISWLYRNHPYHTFSKPIEVDDFDSISLGSNTDWRADDTIWYCLLQFFSVSLYTSSTIWFFLTINHCLSHHIVYRCWWYWFWGSEEA